MTTPHPLHRRSPGWRQWLVAVLVVLALGLALREGSWLWRRWLGGGAPPGETGLPQVLAQVGTSLAAPAPPLLRPLPDPAAGLAAGGEMASGPATVVLRARRFWPWGPVNALLEVDGILWAAGEAGLGRLVGPEGRFEPVAIPAPQASCLAAGRGQLFVGTVAGLLVSRDAGRSFRVIDAAAGLAHELVWALGFDGRVLWVGTQAGLGLLLPDGRLEKVDTTVSGQGLPGLRVGAVLAVDGRLLAGTDQGLSAWDTGRPAVASEAWQVVHLPELPAEPWITALALERDRLWIGTVAGLAARDLRQGFVRRDPVRLWTRRQGLPAERITALVTRGPRLYVGTVGGLAVIEQGLLRRIRLTGDVGPTAGVAPARPTEGGGEEAQALAGVELGEVRALAVADDRLWVGDERGIALVDAAW